MDEFDFDNDVTFSTNINSIKNNNINNKSPNIDEILNYNEDSYKPNNFLSDADIFPCKSNKCKKYTIESMIPNIISTNNNKNKKIKYKKTNKIKIKKNKPSETNTYIIIIILFIIFNNHDLYNFLQNKGVSYYKSVIVRLICFLISYYLIQTYIVN